MLRLWNNVKAGQKSTTALHKHYQHVKALYLRDGPQRAISRMQPLGCYSICILVSDAEHLNVGLFGGLQTST